ncbi:MAG: hypothetical protein HRT72_01420 [Flavobacteriales bacterium]|nr:hypothetical protein [Flavobacteriales bacterium]
MMNSDIEMLSLIVKRRIAETSLYLDSIQRNATMILKSQKGIHNKMRNTSRKNISSNINQAMGSLSNYGKTNILIKRVHQIMQTCTYWKTIQKFLPIIIIDKPVINSTPLEVTSIAPMSQEVRLLGMLQKGLKRIGEHSLSHFVENELLIVKS